MNELKHIPNSRIEIYTNPDNSVQLEVKLDEDTVWLSVRQMATLFGKEDSNIRRHVSNVFKEKELPRESNVHFLHVPFSDKPVPFYSLDVIISVGYKCIANKVLCFVFGQTKYSNSILFKFRM